MSRTSMVTSGPTLSPGYAGRAALAHGRPRLLVVSYHFPPSPGVGALRWAGLTKYMSQEDWDIRVLSAFGDGQWRAAPFVEVEGLPARRTLNDWYRWFKEAWVDREASPSSEGAPSAGAPGPKRADSGTRHRSEGALSRPRSFLRRLGSVLSWPDEGRGWIVSASRATAAAIREFEPDVMVSSGPPHSVHVAVRFARGRSRVPWFLDMRDPWTNSDLVSPSFGFLERSTLRRASGVLVTTPELQDVLARKYPAVPIHWIPNGVDLDLIPATDRPRFPGLSVTHLGTVYGGRDPAPLLEGFSRFLARCPEAKEVASALRFVGSVEPSYLEIIERFQAEGLGDRVEVIPTLPREDALSILQRSSVAVVLAQRQAEMVPAKLYESIALGIPTLVIAEKASATYRAAGRMGALRVEPADEEGIADALGRVWCGGVPRGEAPPVPIDYGGLAQRTSEVLLR